jgi:hypothetical protein
MIAQSGQSSTAPHRSHMTFQLHHMLIIAGTSALIIGAAYLIAVLFRRHGRATGLIEPDQTPLITIGVSSLGLALAGLQTASYLLREDELAARLFDGATPTTSTLVTVLQSGAMLLLAGGLTALNIVNRRMRRPTAGSAADLRFGACLFAGYLAAFAAQAGLSAIVDAQLTGQPLTDFLGAPDAFDYMLPAMMALHVVVNLAISGRLARRFGSGTGTAPGT